MSDPANETGKQGPALSDTVQEVQGWFPNDASLQEALGNLTRAGFDRADFSLPEEQVAPSQATPTESAQNPTDDIDKRQIRTMTGGMAGAGAAMAAAGATIATGGAAAAVIGGAAGAGLLATALTSGAGAAADQAQVEERNRRGAAGTLILAVHIKDQAQTGEVEEMLRQAGATQTQQITRSDEAFTAGVSASSWTG